MPIYSTADKSVLNCLERAVAQHHPDLKQAGVTFNVLMVHAGGESDEPPLKHHGYPAAAVIKVTSLKDRVAGLQDVRLTIDGDGWVNRADEERMALMDHECQHLVLVRDVNGKVKEDDAGRPRLRLRNHDAELGIFYDVIERHGIDALEAQAYREVHRQMTQLKFPWG